LLLYNKLSALKGIINQSSIFKMSARIPSVTIGHVRLLSDGDEFKNSFARFEDYTLNGWSEAK